VGGVVQDMNRSFVDYWNYDQSIALKDLTDVGSKIIGLTNTKPVLELLQSSVNPKLSKMDRNSSDYEYIKNKFTSRAYEVEGRVAFFADPPGKREEVSDTQSQFTAGDWERISQHARESLIIQTPYLCFSKYALNKIKQLRDQYPDLKIIASSNSLASTDNYSTYAISYRQKKHLLKNLKIQIFELKPVPGDVVQMIHGYVNLAAEKENRIADLNEIKPEPSPGPRVGIHGKAFVLDDEIVWIGSHNFDPRSDNINTEVALVIWDKKVAHDLKENILRDIQPQNSWLVAKRWKLPFLSFFSGLIETISKALPILDIWPFYYFTCYELLPGKNQVPPGHPDFYQHYENVGPFPGLNLSIKAIKTRLIKAMGKMATPII
jgi:phosphatidylserine/phosphatidylglycerophosphate/cardiolipin synthase-like enzyme